MPGEPGYSLDTNASSANANSSANNVFTQFGTAPGGSSADFWRGIAQLQGPAANGGASEIFGNDQYNSGLARKSPLEANMPLVIIGGAALLIVGLVLIKSF